MKTICILLLCSLFQSCLESGTSVRTRVKGTTNTSYNQTYKDLDTNESDRSFLSYCEDSKSLDDDLLATLDFLKIQGDINSTDSCSTAYTKLRQLDSLTLFLDVDEVSNLSPIAGLNKLASLRLYSQVNEDEYEAFEVDLMPLRNLISLESLETSNFKITNLDFLINTPGWQLEITSLKLDNASITDAIIEDVLDYNAAKYFETIDITDNQVTTFDSLRRFEKVENLILSGNPVNDISDLIMLKDIKTLDLSRTPLTSFSEILSCTKLENLNLSDTSVDNLEFLLTLKNLKSLKINNTNLLSFRILQEAAFQNLTEFQATGVELSSKFECPTVDVSPIVEEFCKDYQENNN